MRQGGEGEQTKAGQIAFDDDIIPDGIASGGVVGAEFEQSRRAIGGASPTDEDASGRQLPSGGDEVVIVGDGQVAHGIGLSWQLRTTKSRNERRRVK
jgi:hypothetical protein